MKRLHFSIMIDAPKEKVWDTMLSADSYRQWTAPFCPGSFFEGSWQQGSEIKFLAPSKTGEVSGMFSRIKENRHYEYIAIEHLGFVHEGNIDQSSEGAQSLKGAAEIYTLKDHGGKTEVLIEMDSTAEYEEMFLKTWPQALDVLKSLSES